MEKLKPKLFSVMKTYTKEQFIKDVIAGIISIPFIIRFLKSDPKE